MYIKKHFQKNKVPLERRFPRSSGHATKVHARAYCKSTGWVKSPLDSRSSVRHDSARAPNPPLERTVKQCREMLDARILRSSAKFPARAEVRNLEIPDCTSKLKTKLLTTQNRSSWAYFLENSYKHME